MKEEIGGVRLITRGNLDGIMSAAVFLDRFPGAEVTFVTSPPAAARALREGTAPSCVYIADLSLTGELAAAVRSEAGRREIIVADHHPIGEAVENAIIDEGRSAAGILHRCLGSSGRVRNIVALADLYEMSGTDVLRDAVREHGRERLEEECTIQDFAWRHNVEDDGFRLHAAAELAKGLWPSEVPAVMEKYRRVKESGRWNKALDTVRARLERRGAVGILDLRSGRTSLHGFGSKALLEVAREQECRYAVLIHGRNDAAVVSLRAVDPHGIDLGQFAEEFASRHGMGGGGHPASAGARIAREAAALMIDELERASA
ncbi:DHHA1 domain-containing protein [Methanomassiliicoccus luminyensis]|uniref:DHHA1 domain-containing protein n=1 Tax=Methanomassiliicoccus luminyensis TaxID=1080712 RepID=UPI00038289B0|nr:DHHA1 domain-containing protein [Methanomassiliicoccus luminyensis]